MALPTCDCIKGLSQADKLNNIYCALLEIAAGGSGSLILPSQGGTGIVNNDSSTLTISGNFATTLTITGATGVTLPTTGVLATLDGSEVLTNKTLTAVVFTSDTFSLANASATPSVVGSIVTDTTQTGNVGAGEDTLQSYTVPAALLSTNGNSFSFVASGTIANNANAKRLRVKFGATTILDTGASGIPVSTAMDWGVAGIVIRTGAATQKCFVTLTTNTTTLSSFCDYTTAGETLSGAVTFLVTGEAVSDNDIVKELFKGFFEG